MADVIVIPAGDISLSLDSSAGSADLTLQVAGEVSLALDNAQGPAGPPGPPGPIGESILGEVLLANAVSELPPTGEIGDCYLIPNSSSQNELYVWDGLGWTNVGPIQGPQGEPGEVTLAATQTLLNKTLVSPVLNNPRLSTRTPASATATGVQGEVCWDASYLYVCVATNTWKRTAISSW